MIADQVATNYRKADITPRQKAILDFAMKVSVSAHLVGEADFEQLKQHGFNEEDVWDIAGVSAFFGMSNRLANVTNMRPNAEFYGMGEADAAGHSGQRRLLGCWTGRGVAASL